MKAQLTQAAMVHFDETGVRAGGRLPRLHTASDDRYTHLFVHDKCSEQVLRRASSILPLFTGWALHDSLRAYDMFTQAQHGAGNAHILRKLHGVMEGGFGMGQSDAYLRAGHAPSGFVPAGRGGGTSPATLSPDAEPGGVGRTAAYAAKQGSGRPKSTPGRNLLRRLREHEDAVLAAVLAAGVPFINNQAERDPCARPRSNRT